MKRYSTISIRAYSLALDFQGEWVKFDDAMKEIESLRQQLAAEKAKKDIDLVNDPAAWDRLDKALKEIESLREQLSATEEWKKELRNANNEFGSETECWPDLWKRIAELKRINVQEYRDRLECEKEIESLRQWQQEKIRMDAEEGGRLDGYRELGQRAAEAESERDEWKRRFNMLWEWMQSGYTYPDAILYAKDFIQIHPEAAQWYEEE